MNKMAHAKIAPTRKNVSVSINGNVPNPTAANATVGDTITFVNFDDTEKVLRFAIDENGDEFHPIGLIIPPGPHTSVTILAVDPHDGAKSSKAFYSISTSENNGKLRPNPDDDTYQVIVGSSSLI
jgi:hypothetical protein